MKNNPVKKALREGRPTFGTWLSLGNLHAARVLAWSGFEWLTLDLEHSAIDWSQAATIFAAVADATPGLPLIVYNVPGRTGQNLAPAVLSRLWENPAVVAVKESSGNLSQIAEIGRTLPAGKTLLAGDDNLAVASIAVGATGLVSVLGNALPAETKELVTLALAGRREEALALQKRLLPLMDALFLESNPIPVKALLGQLGLGGDALRLPLVPASAATRTRLAEALAFAQTVTA